MHGRLGRDPHSGPVSETALAADAAARVCGRVAVGNAHRADGLDGGWTMDERVWRSGPDVHPERTSRSRSGQTARSRRVRRSSSQGDKCLVRITRSSPSVQ